MTFDAEPRRRLTRPERRTIIEDAAARLVAERGYAATTLVEIAAAAGVTKQLLYQHVSSKRELHLSVLARHRDGLLERIDTGAASHLPAALRIRETLDSWFGYLEEHPTAAPLLFRDVTGDPEVEAFHDGMRDDARAANAGALRTLVPDADAVRIELLAEAVRAATVGLALWWASHPDVARSELVEVAATVATGLVADRA